MKVNSLKCPGCGAEVQVEENKEFALCSYCGTKVMLKNENETVYRHIDDADLKRAETEEMLRLKEIELEEQKIQENAKSKKMKLKIAAILFATSIFLYVMDALIIPSHSMISSYFKLCSLVAFIISIVVFFKAINTGKNNNVK